MVKIDDADRAEFKSLVAIERKAFLASPLSSSSSVTSNGKRRGGGGRALSVVVRKRPLFDAEREKGLLDVVTAASNQRQLHGDNHNYGGGRSDDEKEAATNTANVIVVHEPKTKYDLSKSISNHAFKFDAVFSEMSKTNDVYDRILRPLVNGLDRGAQIAVFAYGQTGSGKTYTMQGLTDMAIDDVFRIVLSPNGRARGLAVCISYFEVYCSKVFDLLNDRSPLVLREDGEGIVQVVGLTEHSTRDPRVLRALIDCGANCRSVGTTRVNADSSRSHGVLQLLVREGRIQRGNSSTTSNGGERNKNFNYDNDDDDDDNDVAGNSGRLLGKLSLVDLAGSEQASESAPPDSQTHQEAAQINTSLLALKECIRAMGRGQKNMMAAALKKRHSSSGDKGSRRGTSMTSGSRRNSNVSAKNHHHLPHTHIPFRGSKLTQILRECFTSEGARTVMVTCVSPGHLAAEHTIGSLRYADRLKGIAIRSNQNVSSSTSAAATALPMRGGVDDNEGEDDDGFHDDSYDEREEELFDEGALVRKTSRLSIASSSSYTGKASKSILSENSTGRQTGVLCNKRGEEVWPESAGPKPLSLVMMMMNAPSASSLTTNNINSTVGADMRMRASTSKSRSSLLGNNSTAAVPPPSSPPPSLPPPSSYHSLVPLSQHQFIPNFQSSTSAIPPPPLPLPPPPQTSSSSSFVMNPNHSEATSTLSKQQQQQQRVVATAVATARAASARVASASSKQQQQQQLRGKSSASSIPASPPPPLMSSMQRVDDDAILVVKSPSHGGGRASRNTSLHDQQIDYKQGQKLFTSENGDAIQGGGRKERGTVTHTEKLLSSTSAATTSAATISPPKRDGRGIKQVNDAADEWKGTIASIRKQQLKQKQEENEKKKRSSDIVFHNAARSGTVTPEWDEELLGRQKPHLSSSSSSSDIVIATSPTPSPRHEGRRGVVDSNSLAVGTTTSAPSSSSLSSSSSSSNIHKADVVSLLDMQIQELLILREKMTAATNSIAKSSSSSVMLSSSMSPTSEKTAARVRLQPRNPAHELPFNVEGGLHKHRSTATPSSPPPPPPPFAIHHPQPSSPPPMQPPSLSLPFNSHFHQHSSQVGGGRVSTEDEDVIGTNTRSIKSHGSSGHPLPPPLPSTKTGRNNLLSSSSSSLSINGEEKILSPERRPTNRVKTTSQQGVTSGGKGGGGQDSIIGFDQKRLYEEQHQHQQFHQQEPVRAVLRGQRQAGALGSATVSSSSSGMIPRPYSSTSSDRVPQERKVSSITTAKVSDKERLRLATKPSPYAEPLLANFNSSRNRVRRGSKASSQSSVDQSMMSMLMITSPAKPSLRSSFALEKSEKSAYMGGAGSAAEFRTRKY